MKSQLFFRSILLLLIGFVAAAIYYLNLPDPRDVKGVSPASAPVVATDAQTGTEGAMETVTTPPQTFQGRLSPEATSMDAFSSNPKRETAEQAVLDLAIDRSLAKPARVERLLGMIPTLPPDAQTLAMENATALIPDKDYLAYRSRLHLLATSPEMREAVMDDSLTRGEELRLPNLLEMMRSSTNEKEKLEIREILEAYLDQDFGPQPAQWEAPLKKWVAENADI